MSRGERVAWGLAAVVFGALVFVWLRKARGATIINRTSGDVIVPALDLSSLFGPSWLGLTPDASGGVFSSSWNPCGCGCDNDAGSNVTGNSLLPAAAQGPGPEDGEGGRAIWQSMFYFSELPNGTVH